LPSSPLTLLLDFDDQYHRDQRQRADFLHRRDRQQALEHQRRHGVTPDPATWLRAITGAPARRPSSDPRLRGWRRLRVLFVVAGAVLGALTMLGLLYYDGGRRINITLIVAVALLQLLLALATSAQTLLDARPWPGLFRQGAPRWWPLPEPAPMLRLLQSPLAAGVAHSGGLAFAFTALLTLLVQVVVSDLAFGWSTTLQASATGYHQLMAALAWPWHTWLPAAVPSLELVEQSRYFRLGDSVPANPGLLGGWWAFLVMLWLCYVVLPRALLLIATQARINRRATRLLRTHAGMAALLERFATPYVESEQHGDADHGPLNGGNDHPPGPALPISGALIRWAGAGEAHSALAGHLIRDASPLILDAGGGASLEQDTHTLELAAQHHQPLVIVTRGWEPPTGELKDFLTDARARCTADTPLILVPLAAQDSPAPAHGDTLAQWQRFVRRHGDPHLSVAAMPTAEAPR
jgi:uncharacterized membrane protein